MDVSKCRDGRVYFRNSGLKGFITIHSAVYIVLSRYIILLLMNILKTFESMKDVLYMLVTYSNLI